MDKISKILPNLNLYLTRQGKSFSWIFKDLAKRPVSRAIRKYLQEYNFYLERNFLLSIFLVSALFLQISSFGFYGAYESKAIKLRKGKFVEALDNYLSLLAPLKIIEEEILSYVNALYLAFSINAGLVFIIAAESILFRFQIEFRSLKVIAHFFLKIYFYVIYFFVFELALTIFSCKADGKFSNIENLDSSKTGCLAHKETYIIISLITLLISLLFGGLVNIRSNNILNYAKDGLSRSESSVEFYVWLLSTANCIFNILVVVNGNSVRVVAATMNFLFHGFLLRKLYHDQPYRNEAINDIHAVFFSLTCFRALIRIFSLLLENNKDLFDGWEACVFVIIGPLVTKVSINRMKSRRKYLLCQLENEVDNPRLLIKKCMLIENLMEKASSYLDFEFTQNKEVLAAGFFREHVQNCKELECFCSEFELVRIWTAEKFSKFGILLIESIYKKALSKQANEEKKLHIWGALFYLKQMKLQKKAYLLLQEMSDKEDFFSEEGIQAEMISSYILKSLSTQKTTSTVDLNEPALRKPLTESIDEDHREIFNDILTCESVENEVFLLIQNKVDELLDFWNELYQDRPKLARIEKISKDIHKSIRRVEKIHKRLQSTGEHNIWLSERYRCLMGVFYNFVANDPKRACTFLQLNQSFEKKAWLKKREEPTLNTVIMRVSLDDKKAGSILEFTRNSERIFGFPAGSLINQPVEILFTKLNKEVHREYFKGVLADNEGTMSGSKSEMLLFGAHKKGVCFPMMLKYIYDFNEKFGLHLLSSFKVLEDMTGEDYIITDFNGVIDSSTKRIRKWLTDKKDSCIFDSCTELEEIYAGLNKSHAIKAPNEIKLRTLKPQSTLTIQEEQRSSKQLLEESCGPSLIGKIKSEGIVLSFQPLVSVRELFPKFEKPKNIENRDLFTKTLSTSPTSTREYLVKVEEQVISGNNIMRLLILKQVNNTLSSENKEIVADVSEEKQTKTQNLASSLKEIPNDFHEEEPSQGEGKKESESENNSAEEAGLVQDELSEIFIRNKPNIQFLGRRGNNEEVEFSQPSEEKEKTEDVIYLDEPDKKKFPSIRYEEVDVGASAGEVMAGGQSHENQEPKHETVRGYHSAPRQSHHQNDSKNSDDSTNINLRRTLRNDILFSLKEIETIGNEGSVNFGMEEKALLSGNVNSHFRIISEISEAIYKKTLSFTLRLFKIMIFMLMLTFLVLICLNFLTSRSINEKLIMYDKTLSYADYSAHNVVECQRLIQLVRGEIYFKFIPENIFRRYNIPVGRYINEQIAIPSSDYFFQNITHFDEAVLQLGLNFHSSKNYKIDLVRKSLNGENVLESTTLFRALELIRNALQITAGDVLKNANTDDESLWSLVVDNIPNNILLAFEDLTGHLRQSLADLIEKDSTTIKIVFTINVLNLTLNGILFLVIFRKSRDGREKIGKLLIAIENSAIEKRIQGLQKFRAALLGKQEKSRNREFIRSLKPGRSMTVINSKGNYRSRINKEPELSSYHLKWTSFSLILLICLSPLIVCISLDFVSFQSFFEEEVKMFNKISLMSEDKLLQKTMFMIFLDMVLTQSKSKVRNNDIESEMLNGINEVGRMNIFFQNFMSGGTPDPDFNFLLSDRACELTGIFCQLHFGITNRGFFEARGIKIDLLNEAFSLWTESDRSIEVSRSLMNSLILLNLIHLDYYEGITMEWFLNALRQRFTSDIENTTNKYPGLLGTYTIVLLISAFLLYRFLFSKCRKKFFDSKHALGLISYDIILSNKIITNYIRKNSDGNFLLKKLAK